MCAERYVVRASPTLPGVWGVWDTERRQWSLYVTQDQEDAERLCELWNALDAVWRRKGRARGASPQDRSVREEE
jgi:hypothetical protein